MRTKPQPDRLAMLLAGSMTRPAAARELGISLYALKLILTRSIATREQLVALADWSGLRRKEVVRRLHAVLRARMRELEESVA